MRFIGNKTICLLIVLFFSGVLTFFNYQQREYDWDMPGYLGCLFSLEYSEDEAIHSATYEAIRNEASISEFEAVIGKNGNKARTYFYNYPGAFVQQIPYYSIKTLYNALIFVFYKMGVGAGFATILPNLLAFFLSGIVFFFTFTEIFKSKLYIATLLAISFLCFPPYQYLSRISSPDCLAIFFLLVFIYAIIKKWTFFYQFSILILLMLVRPDYVLFVLGYLGLVFLIDLVLHKRWNAMLVLYTLITVGIYNGILSLCNYPGWDDVFFDTFITRRLDIAKEPIELTFGQYTDVVSKGFMSFKKVTLFSLGFLVLSLYFAKDSKSRLLAFFFCANVFIKFVISPDPGELRFFVGFLFLQLIWLISILSKNYTIQKSTS